MPTIDKLPPVFSESVVIHCLITLKKCCASTRCRLSGFYINSLTMLRDLWRDLSPVGRQLKKVQGSQMRVKMGRKHWTNPKIYDLFCLYFCLINILVSFSYQAFKITSLNIERHSNISTRQTFEPHTDYSFEIILLFLQQRIYVAGNMRFCSFCGLLRADSKISEIALASQLFRLLLVNPHTNEQKCKHLR